MTVVYWIYTTAIHRDTWEFKQRRRRRWFPFRKRSMTFLTVDATIGNQTVQNERCHACFSLGLDKVQTGYSLLME